MTPTNPTPPWLRRDRSPSRRLGRSHHDDHLYDQADLHNEDVAHEHSDVNIRAIIGFGVGLFAVVGGVRASIVLGLFKFFESQAAANDPVMSPLAQPAGQLPPEPRLLTDEPQNLQRFRDSLAERLKGIDEAKKQLLQQGLPVRADAPVDPWMGTHSPSRGESSGGRTIPIRCPVTVAAPASARRPPGDAAEVRRALTNADACEGRRRHVGHVACARHSSSLGFAALLAVPGVVSAQRPLAAAGAGRSHVRQAWAARRRSGSTSGSTRRCRSISTFVDETGRDVKLGDYFGKRPVLLALVYYECPMLCTQVLNGVTGALKVLNFDVGKEFDVVAVSINPREGPGLAAAKKQAYLERYGRPETADGWHFLTGREENIRALANAVGFRYAVRRRDQAVRARCGGRAADAEGRHRPLLLRDRVFAARYPPRDHRGLRGEDRVADR